MSQTCKESDAESSAVRVQDDENILPLSDHVKPPVVPDATKDDDSSYVRLPSAPNSLNTIISTKSMEDMVLVESDRHLGN